MRQSEILALDEPLAITDAVLLPHELLRPRTDQPRKYFDPVRLAELKSNIAELHQNKQGIEGTGILQPLLVSRGPLNNNGRPSFFPINAGERRWRASDGVTPLLPCIIKDIAVNLAREYALIENMQREGLTPEEEANGVTAMMQAQKLSARAVARKLGVSQGWISNRLALLGLEADLREMVLVRPNSMSSAQLLAKVRDTKLRTELIEAVKEGASYQDIANTIRTPVRPGKQIATTNGYYGSAKLKGMQQAPKFDVEAELESIASRLGTVQDAVAAIRLTKHAKAELRAALGILREKIEALEESVR